MNTQESKRVVVRFPPSPTGPIHIGNIRTALFNYFFTKKNSGSFILRIEDTDKVRSKPEFEKEIIDSLTWLGLKHDGEVKRQSERTAVYKKYLDKLIEEQKAYISVEEGGQNREVVRFKNPNKKITFKDTIRGDVTFDTTELEDFVIARNINEPVYHLSVVIDDFESGVTHIIRGEDHISNTPRQILIQEALEIPRPEYAHIPLILAKDKSKLSKRKHGETVSLKYYRETGFLPQAIINYLALLGWNPGTNKEIFNMDEIVNIFDLKKVQKGGAVFDLEKLKWINKEHIKKLSDLDLESEVLKRIDRKIPETLLKRLVPVIIERVSFFGEIDQLYKEGEFNFYFESPFVSAKDLVWKGDMKDSGSTQRHIERILQLIEEIPENMWQTDVIKQNIWDYANEAGRGEVLWPMRYALSGKEKSPDPFTIAFIIGKNATVERLRNALHTLDNK